jgi:hypothetical protein
VNQQLINRRDLLKLAVLPPSTVGVLPITG